MNEGINMNRS